MGCSHIGCHVRRLTERDDFLGVMLWRNVVLPVGAETHPTAGASLHRKRLQFIDIDVHNLVLRNGGARRSLRVGCTFDYWSRGAMPQESRWCAPVRSALKGIGHALDTVTKRCGKRGSKRIWAHTTRCGTDEDPHCAWTDDTDLDACHRTAFQQVPNPFVQCIRRQFVPHFPALIRHLQW